MNKLIEVVTCGAVPLGYGVYANGIVLGHLIATGHLIMSYARVESFANHKARPRPLAGGILILNPDSSIEVARDLFINEGRFRLLAALHRRVLLHAALDAVRDRHLGNGDVRPNESSAISRRWYSYCMKRRPGVT